MKKFILFIFFIALTIISWKATKYFTGAKEIEAALVSAFCLIVGFCGAGAIIFSAIFDVKGNGHYSSLEDYL